MSSITLTCKNCRTKYNVIKARQKTSKFCSRECCNKYVRDNGFSEERRLKMSKKANNRTKEWREKVSKTWFKKNSTPWNKNKSVRLSPKSEFKKGKKHPYFGKRGSELHQYKGKIKNTHGYILLYKPNHCESFPSGHVLEHRYKISNKLKRKLKPKEVIHHIDGNRSNNKVSNLLLLSSSDHAKLHSKAYDYLIENNLTKDYIKWFKKNC